jgi:serine/threonine-protein kinase
MGVVYRATDPTIGRTVALKTIRSELVGQAVGGSIGQLAERFRNEARAAGSLNHRNIVTIYDAGEHQGTFFIAMEYLEGTTLQKLIADRRSLRPEEVVRIGGQICEGLEFAHARGIVHRRHSLRVPGQERQRARHRPARPASGAHYPAQ